MLEKITRNLINEAISNQKRAGQILVNDAVETGYLDLDYALGGLRRGETYILGGRPAMGKKAFSINLIDNIAVQNNKCVAMFSVTQGKEPLINRLVQLVSKIEYVEFRKGLRQYQSSVDVGISKLEHANVYIDDTPRISVEEIDAYLDKVPDQLDLIIIDNLQMIGDVTNETRYFESLDRLKKIAVKRKCPIFILSEVSHTPEERVDHRPVVSDFGLGKIERHVDNILFLYRDEYYNRQTEMRGIAEISIARNKHGDAGVVLLAWIPEYQKFCSLEHCEDDIDEEADY